MKVPIKASPGTRTSDRRFIHSRAFTLIELVTVLAIIALLISLLSSAIQQARESARRLQCLNQIRQQALAIQNFHQMHGLIPSNGGADPGNDLSIVGGPSLKPSTTDLDSNVFFRWGVGDPSREPRNQTGSWAFSILPFVERDAEFYGHAVGASFPIFACPSRSRGAPMATANDAYGNYESGGLAMTKTDYCGNQQLMLGLPNYTSFRDIQDGLSSTVLIGEKPHDPVIQIETSWYWDEPIWIGGSNGTVRSGVLIVSDHPGTGYRINWGSAHVAGANFAFADGHCRLISNSVDWKLLLNSLTPHGSESESLSSLE